eukprot:3759911-Karenia_brevis.AAC.1
MASSIQSSWMLLGTASRGATWRRHWVLSWTMGPHMSCFTLSTICQCGPLLGRAATCIPTYHCVCSWRDTQCRRCIGGVPRMQWQIRRSSVASITSSAPSPPMRM